MVAGFGYNLMILSVIDRLCFYVFVFDNALGVWDTVMCMLTLVRQRWHMSADLVLYGGKGM